MATLHPSLVTRLCCLNCGATEVSKLASSSSSFTRSTMSRTFDKMASGKEQLCQGFMPDVMTTPHNVSLKVCAARVSIEPTEQTFTLTTEVGKLEKESTYLFRTETGDQVKVSVGKKNLKYAVHIQVSSPQSHSSSDRLLLSWGVYRSDSRCYMTEDFQDSSPDGRTFETLFNQISLGTYTLELEFEAKQIPFFLSFLLKPALEVNSSGSEIRSHRGTKFCVPVGLGRGNPFPLGLSFATDGSLNISIFSRSAEGLVLCLYDDASEELPALELDLDPYVHRSGDIWHVSLESAETHKSYAFRCRGESVHQLESAHTLLDPYCKIVMESRIKDKGSGVNYRGLLMKEPTFDWSGDVHPNIPLEKLTVYRLNVKRFTEHKSSSLSADVPGTFSGLAQKLDHLKDLGVNAVLLEPTFSYDEKKGPYFPCHFFSPASLFGPSNNPISTIESMKDMVKRLHMNGIEVFLEVVFTHTADAGALQGIDDVSYYVNGPVELKRRNALNCNYPIVQQMILDSLRYWLTEFHVDGFCFINASSLLRGFHGESLSRSPLIEAIAFDPVLSRTKVIADSWDPIDEATMDVHFPHWKRWAEVNTKFCTDIRKFLRGEGFLSDLATRLCGSGDIFSDGRGPSFSFNYVSRNFGLPLVDLVSFSSGQLAPELSWNCGEEGPTNKPAVLERRLKQIRNFLFILYISLGVPILNMGDECGQSTGGSPAYVDRKSFDWNALKTGFAIQTTRFISFLNAFRKRRADLLQSRNFLKEENIDWHGNNQSPPKWEDTSCKFLSMTLKTEKAESQSSSETSHEFGDLFIAFNAGQNSECVILPVPLEGTTWHRMIDTALPYPGFFSADGEPVLEQMGGLFAYEIKSHSCALFESRSQGG
ncbi:isoamylase 2, chloroplastic [Rhodamnia argentea]|uniref:Isoamylase 2, chloroplastic n=1 Tax=Rhodamnia argentea TaxID=178133 RepID=A0A8B8N5K0_9MYRT|nr:isoamylase 2, chloroplastic [Rhodamnia argentea]XP_030517670.2 isoamylase 2, chloroplastic [Rhodamnia argentea]XP_048137696.1 isoamylase 2, chloroplastic [Rhodamnia argentea]